MSELIAKKNWIGAEGKISRGQSFEAKNKEREKELVESGRAVYATESKSVEVKETKGGSTADKSEKKDVETKESKPTETKEQKPAKRKRRTKAEIEADKAKEDQEK